MFHDEPCHTGHASRKRFPKERDRDADGTFAGAAFLLSGFTLLAAIIFHSDFANQVQFVFFMKNLAIAGGLLALVAHGPGPLALDTRGK